MAPPTMNSPTMTPASAAKPHRILTAAQRARRTKRQALGIADVRKATWGDELLARVSDALPTHADAVAIKVAAQKKQKGQKDVRNVPVLGAPRSSTKRNPRAAAQPAYLGGRQKKKSVSNSGTSY